MKEETGFTSHCAWRLLRANKLWTTLVLQQNRKQTNVITLKPLHLFCNFYDNCNNWRKKQRFEFYSYKLGYGYLPVKWVNAICSEHSLLLSVNLTIFSSDREKSSTGIKQNHNTCNEHNITFNLVTSINWTTVDWCKTSSVNCLVHMVLFVPTSCSMSGGMRQLSAASLLELNISVCQSYGSCPWIQ